MTENSGILQDKAADIFPQHVRNIQGITVNKEPVTFEMLSEEIVFLNLCIEIYGKLLEISSITEDEEKN